MLKGYLGTLDFDHFLSIRYVCTVQTVDTGNCTLIDSISFSPEWNTIHRTEWSNNITAIWDKHGTK